VAILLPLPQSSSLAQKGDDCWLNISALCSSKKSKLLIPQHKNQRKIKVPFDWLNLIGVLLIPFVIAAGTLYFTQQITFQQAQTSEQQHQTDIQLAQDQQQETTLEKYLDDMKDLLLNHGLGSYKSVDAVSQVAKVETFTTLRRLDPNRKGILLNFLFQARLISFKVLTHSGSRQTNDIDINPIINLSQADLSAAILDFAHLNNFSIVSISQEINCDGLVDQTNKDVTQQKFPSIVPVRGIYLEDTNLNGVHMHEAQLSLADLSNASLENADLSFTQMNCVDLSSSDLRGANLNYAELAGTDFSDADLSGANLFKALVSLKQLAQASSLKGATMPDGSVHP